MTAKDKNNIFVLFIVSGVLLAVISAFLPFMGHPYYSVVPGALACISLVFAAAFSRNENNKKLSIVSSFSLYLSFLLAFTVLGRNIYPIFNHNSLSDAFRGRVYIVPFKNIEYYGSLMFTSQWKNAFINFFGNLIALTPFSFYLPRLYGKAYRRKTYFICLFCMVSFIEITQLILGCGVFDIDDYILNMSGAWIAYELLSGKKARVFLDRFLGTVSDT